eukprot:SAG31_NODE_6558_length_1976_cov_4.575422_2_plen_143_part_00
MPEALRHIERLVEERHGELPDFGISKNTINKAILSWYTNRKLKAGSIYSCGKRLFSYGQCIGDSDVEGKTKTVYNYTAGGLGYISQTTSCHVNRAMAMKMQLDQLDKEELDNLVEQYLDGIPAEADADNDAADDDEYVGVFT